METAIIGVLKTQTVLDFLTQQADQNNRPILPPMMVDKDASVLEVGRTLLEKRVHRLWLEADDIFPTGAVISCSDIIAAILAISQRSNSNRSRHSSSGK